MTYPLGFSCECGLFLHVSSYFRTGVPFSYYTGLSTSSPVRLAKHMDEDGYKGLEGIPLRRQESMRLP